MNHPTIFLPWDNKIKLVPASLSYFLELYWEKNKSYLEKCDSFNRYNLSAIKEVKVVKNTLHKSGTV